MNLGTIETISSLIGDRLDTITSLDGHNTEFRITEEDGTEVSAWTTVLDTEGMRVDSLIDTTNWTPGIYKLYLRVNIPPEMPVLGPVEFEVS